jgi:hypothetical protein
VDHTEDKIGQPLPNEEDDSSFWETQAERWARIPEAEAEREATVQRAIAERAARLKQQRRR